MQPGEGVAEARVGRVLKNKWRLDRLIGVGGMAAVYQATHRNGKRVAIKMLHAEFSNDVTQRKRFLREGYAANAIEHSGVVRIDDDDVDEDGSAFLVMELLTGCSLDSLLSAAGGRLRPERVLQLVDQLLGVLEAAHEKGIIHRDIKPENLFVKPEGALKVLDFGIARVRELGPATGSQTAVGSLLGTPAYMAPEQARGRWELVDPRTDLWSVGATMFVLLSGEHVHVAGTPNEQLALTITLPARSLGSLTPELPKSLIGLVDRALEYQPPKRWQTAAAMREALRAVMNELGVAPSSRDSTSSEAEFPDSPSRVPAESSTIAARTSGPAVNTLANAPTEGMPDRARPRRRLRRTVWAVGLFTAIGVAAIMLLSVQPREAPSPEPVTTERDHPASAGLPSLKPSVQFAADESSSGAETTPKSATAVPSASTAPASATAAREASSTPTANSRTLPARSKPARQSQGASSTSGPARAPQALAAQPPRPAAPNPLDRRR